MSNDFFEPNLETIGDEDRFLSDKILKLKMGDNTLRILPPWRRGAQYYKAYKMHFGLADLRNYGLDIDSWMAEPCISEITEFDGETTKTVMNKCPLCKLAFEASRIGTRDSNPELSNLSSRIRAKRQYASNVYDLQTQSGPKIVVYGKKIFDGLKATIVRKGNITHPEKGWDVILCKKEISGQQWSDYTVLPDGQTDFTKTWNEIKGSLINLDEFPVYSKYEEILERISSVSFGPQISIPFANGPIPVEHQDDGILSDLNFDEV